MRSHDVFRFRVIDVRQALAELSQHYSLFHAKGLTTDAC